MRSSDKFRKLLPRTCFFLLSICITVCLTSCKKEPASDVKKATDQQEQTMLIGHIKPGIVRLPGLNVEFEIPVAVYAKDHGGQWLANSTGGGFKLAIALFENAEGKSDPYAIVKKRAKTLLSEAVDPVKIDTTLLNNLNAVKGYESRLILKESAAHNKKLISSRTYYILAVQFTDNKILVFSIDANDKSFDNTGETFDQLISTIRTFNNHAGKYEKTDT